jgi:DNA-binding NtrC family response regulator
MPHGSATNTAYDWPENIRELRNAIERALLLGTSEVIQPEDLLESLRETIETDDPSKNSLNSRGNAFRWAIFGDSPEDRRQCPRSGTPAGYPAL